MFRAVLFVILLLTSTKPGLANTSNQDPFESFNRKSFSVHQFLDTYFARPVALTYRTVVPSPARTAVGNFFRNISEPVTMVNTLAQGQWKRFAQSSGRFIINSTFGLLGLIDISSYFGIDDAREDTDQTLAVAGIPSGPYLFIPLLGPTTPRHLIGRGFDFALTPYSHFDQWEERDGAYALNILHTRSELIDPLDDLSKTSADLYTSFRSFYFQNRESEINNGEIDMENLPDVLDLGEE